MVSQMNILPLEQAMALPVVYLMFFLLCFVFQNKEPHSLYANIVLSAETCATTNVAKPPLICIALAKSSKVTHMIRFSIHGDCMRHLALVLP